MYRRKDECKMFECSVVSVSPSPSAPSVPSFSTQQKSESGLTFAFDSRTEDEEMWRKKGIVYPACDVPPATYKGLFFAIKDGNLVTQFSRDQICHYLVSAPKFHYTQPGLIHEFIYDASAAIGVIPSTFVNLGNEYIRTALDLFTLNTHLTSRYVNDYWSAATLPRAQLHKFKHDISSTVQQNTYPNVPVFESVCLNEATYNYTLTRLTEQPESGKRNLTIAESIFSLPVSDKSATFLIYSTHSASLKSRATLIVGGVFYDYKQFQMRQEGLFNLNVVTNNGSDTAVHNERQETFSSPLLQHGAPMCHRTTESEVPQDCARPRDTLSPKSTHSCNNGGGSLTDACDSSRSNIRGNSWQEMMDKLNVSLETVICVQCLLWGKSKPDIQSVWHSSQSVLVTTSTQMSRNPKESVNGLRLEAWYNEHMHHTKKRLHGFWQRGEGFVTFDFRSNGKYSQNRGLIEFTLPYARITSLMRDNHTTRRREKISQRGSTMDSLIREMDTQHCFLTRDANKVFFSLCNSLHTQYNVIGSNDHRNIANFFNTLTQAGVHVPCEAFRLATQSSANQTDVIRNELREIKERLQQHLACNEPLTQPVHQGPDVAQKLLQWIQDELPKVVTTSVVACCQNLLRSDLVQLNEPASLAAPRVVGVPMPHIEPGYPSDISDTADQFFTQPADAVIVGVPALLHTDDEVPVASAILSNKNATPTIGSKAKCSSSTRGLRRGRGSKRQHSPKTIAVTRVLNEGVTRKRSRGARGAKSESRSSAAQAKRKRDQLLLPSPHSVTNPSQTASQTIACDSTLLELAIRQITDDCHENTTADTIVNNVSPMVSGQQLSHRPEDQPQLLTELFDDFDFSLTESLHAQPAYSQTQPECSFAQLDLYSCRSGAQTISMPTLHASSTLLSSVDFTPTAETYYNFYPVQTAPTYATGFKQHETNENVPVSGTQQTGTGVTEAQMYPRLCCSESQCGLQKGISGKDVVANEPVNFQPHAPSATTAAAHDAMSASASQEATVPLYRRTFAYQGNGKRNLHVMPCSENMEDVIVCEFVPSLTGYGFFDEKLVKVFQDSQVRPGPCRCSKNAKCTPACFYDYSTIPRPGEKSRKLAQVKNGITREPYITLKGGAAIGERENRFCHWLERSSENSICRLCPLTSRLEHRLVSWPLINPICGHQVSICASCVGQRKIPELCSVDGCRNSIDQLLVVSMQAQCNCGNNIIYNTNPIGIQYSCKELRNEMNSTITGSSKSICDWLKRSQIFKNTIYVAGTLWIRNFPSVYIEKWSLVCTGSDQSDSVCLLMDKLPGALVVVPFGSPTFSTHVQSYWGERCKDPYKSERLLAP